MGSGAGGARMTVTIAPTGMAKAARENAPHPRLIVYLPVAALEIQRVRATQLAKEGNPSVVLTRSRLQTYRLS